MVTLTKLSSTSETDSSKCGGDNWIFHAHRRSTGNENRKGYTVVPRESIIMLVYLFWGTSGFLRQGQCGAEMGGWYLKCWCLKTSKYCHPTVPPCLATALKLSSVSTSPPIKACFSAVTKGLSAHRLLPAWLLLVWFVVHGFFPYDTQHNMVVCGKRIMSLLIRSLTAFVSYRQDKTNCLILHFNSFELLVSNYFCFKCDIWKSDNTNYISWRSSMEICTLKKGHVDIWTRPSFHNPHFSILTCPTPCPIKFCLWCLGHLLCRSIYDHLSNPVS